MRYLYNTLMFFVIQIGLASAHDLYEAENDTSKIRISLEEISVFSQKYSGDILSLPAAVSSLPARVIESNAIHSLPDISAIVPNFFMPDYGSKLTSPVYIRGIGTRINTPSVGLYVDGIPYFEKSAYNFDFFDLKRIEVLRGPQGTLYGRNTMGGLINIFTAEPSFHRHSAVKFSYGNYNQINTNILHNQPFSENLSMMVNFNQRHSDGFFTNVYDNKKIDKLNSYSGRIKLLYTPSDKLRTQFNIQGETSKQGGYPYAIFDSETQSAKSVNYNHPASYNRDLLSSGLNVNYLEKNFKINSATSFQYLNDMQDIDQDFTERDLYEVQQMQKQYMVGQEVSLQSFGNKIYDWLFGVFAFHQTMDKQVDMSTANPQAETGLPRNYDSKYYDSGNSGVAFFHNSELKLGGFTLSGGIRFDYEKATLDYRHFGTPNNYEKEQTLKEEWDSGLDFFEILPKVSLCYDFGGRLTSYAIVAKGYNAGGFNSTIERDEDRSFKPEQSWNYEWGLKGRFLQNRIFANLALFHIDWKNQQIYQPVPSGQGSMLKNAGKSKSRGVEFDTRIIPFANAEISATFGWNDAEFVEYKRSESLDYGGNILPYVPQFTFSGSGSYTLNINGNALDNIRLYLTYQGLGKHYWHEDNSAWQDYYGLLNGRITLSRKNTELSFQGKNLLGSEYNSFYFTALGNQYVQIGKPMTIGVDVKIKF